MIRGLSPNFASRGYLALEMCQNFEQDISRRKLFEAVADEDGQLSEVHHGQPILTPLSKRQLVINPALHVSTALCL